jgi:Amt family ammonium transporter
MKKKLNVWIALSLIAWTLLFPIGAAFSGDATQAEVTTAGKEVAAAGASATPAPAKIDTGDTAWMLTSAALVLLMTPGLALFYGGMVRTKNVLGTIMHSFITIAVITVQWILFGYSLAFGPDVGG